MHLDSVHDYTETSSIALEILLAKSDSGASLHCDRGPMKLLYGPELRLEIFLRCV
jgi:hypothetical protein